jgi:hypothetical protein
MFVFFGTIGTKPRAATSSLSLPQAEPAQKIRLRRSRILEID